MSPQAVVIDGTPRQLGQRIGRGGEGEIFLLADDKSLAIKIYTMSELGDRAAKIRALVEGKLAEKAPLVAFPLAEVRSKAGRFLGFAMRLVDGYKPLHELYAPGPRKVHFPHADYRFLVRSASNIARAVASVHGTGCVIGDINHSGILVSSKAVVALIDADSFQVKTQAGQFLCSVGVPEYTPPELQRKSLAGVLRTPNHDAFGLAVVIFQLLFMGRHPFVGTVRKGDIPPLHENIAAHRYVYTDTRNVGMDQPPGTPAISDFYAPLATAFDRAFLCTDGRPAAEEWVRILDALEQSLAKCQDNSLHYIPRDASDCAWCEMERQLGTFLFLPYIPVGTMAAGTDPGEDAFDVETIWRRIQEVKAATDTRLSPKLPSFNFAPSEAAKKAKKGSGQWNALSIGLVIGAIVGVFTAPKLFVFWGLLLFVGVNTIKSKKSLDETPFRTAYIASEQIYQRELANWKKRNGAEDFLKRYAELEEARDEYQLAKKVQAGEISKLSEQRRSAQLNAYLDTFPIEQANLPGIGPATKAVLASYGIDTAADIVDGRIQNVPGIGNALSKKLLVWREKLEKQFVYRPDLTAVDRAAIMQARVRAETKVAPLRAKLIAGPQNLAVLAARMREIASAEDVVLARAKQHVGQAKCDLDFLGIATPHVPGPAPGRISQPPHTQSPPSPGSWRSPPTAPPASAPSGRSGVTCPRCGQAMVKRLARRGRNAGNYFWGCSRFPVCKGTRNI